MLHDNPFRDSRVCVCCTRCSTPVFPGDDSFLALVGHIVKLRCTQCQFEDWYLQSEFFLTGDGDPKLYSTDGAPRDEGIRPAPSL